MDIVISEKWKHLVLSTNDTRYRNNEFEFHLRLQKLYDSILKRIE